MARSGAYLPTSSPFGAAGDGPPAGPMRPLRGNQTRREDLGSPVGRRGAGMTTLGGGQTGAHVFNHYGKNGPPELTGGTLDSGPHTFTRDAAKSAMRRMLPDGG